MPGWVPAAARHYLAHVSGGTPIRALAREAQVHASTILRQVRRFETLRDDPLVDEALHVLARHMAAEGGQTEETTLNTAATDIDAQGPEPAAARIPPSETRILREGARVLRRLNEARTVLAVARDMEMGVVVREGPDGAPERLAVVGRDIAQAMALKDWITCADPSARVIRYRITATGRQMLRAALHDERRGLAEAPAPFAAAPGTGDRMLRHMRSLLGESPVTVLARRRSRDGTPWLTRAQIAAAERLREDFELSRSGPRAATGWEAYLAATAAAAAGAGLHQAEHEAHARLAAALGALGPGLADVALRCCCFLEGLESVEEQMGWSARSGKVVLRVALDHLQRHYAATIGRYAPPIG
ncbi:MAG: helix-turn-helix domain-containing protein [Rubellimicrobium sp.]|nr:helix-turn-helix domain-containing protein [Rubellimicrobium sp.]